MIPTKRTKYSFPPEGYAKMTQEEKNAVHARLNARPKTTEAQKLAQKENFTIFQLKSMQSRLGAAEMYFPDTTAEIRKQLEWMIKTIKSIQEQRKQKKEKNHG